MRVAAFLSKLFNIRPGEWRRLLVLYCMSLTVLTGMTWADAIVQGSFLQHVGVQYLPWVFIACAAFSFGAMFIYSAFADRMSNARLLIGLLAISGAGILLGLVALAGGQVGLGYLVLFAVLQVPLLDVYNVHWATYVNGFYDIRTAKRIVPVLSTSARFAGIIGGLSMPAMNRLLNPAGILMVGVASLAVMALLAAFMPRIMHERRAKPVASLRSPDSPSPAYSARLRDGYDQIARSPFLRWMALSTFCMTVLLALLNYQASAIFQDELKTTVAISDFLGLLSGVANLVVLPFQLFVLSRLIGRLGLGNASLIYPATSLAAAGSLAIAPGLGTAAFAYLDRMALRTAFRIPTDNLLYNAVPARVKARTRAFVGGLAVPVAVILSGLLLLTPLMRTAWFLPTALLTIASAFALAALMVRRHYGPALVDLLAQEDYSSLALQAPSPLEPIALAPADLSTVTRLAEKLSETTSPERAVFTAQLLVAVADEAAVPIVGQAVHAAIDGRLAASLVDVLTASGLRRAGVRELYAELVSHADGRVRLAAVNGLALIDGSRDRRFLEVAARLLADPEIEVRLRILPDLLGAGDLGLRAAATAAVRGLLEDPEPRVRVGGLGVVGQTRAIAFLPDLVRAMRDRDDEVRLAAALAVESLVDDSVPSGDRDVLLAALAVLLHDPIERVRVAAVTASGRLDTSLGRSGPEVTVARRQVIQGLADPSFAVRERAVDLLSGAGRQAIPHLHNLLEATDPQVRSMAAVALAHMDPRKFTASVRECIVDSTLQPIYRNLACMQALAGSPGPVTALLRRALGEQNEALLDHAFYLMAELLSPGTVETVRNSLCSAQPEARANAAEALESLTTPQIAALVAPLFEPVGSQTSRSLRSLAKQTWGLSIATPAAALRELLNGGGDSWQRTLAAAALAELAVSIDPAVDDQLVELLSLAQADADACVAAEARRLGPPRRLATTNWPEARQGETLTLVERLVVLQQTRLFQGTSIGQMRLLASVCEQRQFAPGASLFGQGDPGGVVFVVVSGRVGVEQEKRKSTPARLHTVEAVATVGEAEFFDESRRAASAVALTDTWALCLRREPVMALARQHPELSLALVGALSARLRQANDHIAELARTRPRELHKLFDQFR